MKKKKMTRRAPAAAVSARVARALFRSADLQRQSEILRCHSQNLLRRPVTLTSELETLKVRAEDSIVHGFVVAREGRRLGSKLRLPYASPAQVEHRTVDLAGFRRHSRAR